MSSSRRPLARTAVHPTRGSLRRLSAGLLMTAGLIAGATTLRAVDALTLDSTHLREAFTSTITLPTTINATSGTTSYVSLYLTNTEANATLTLGSTGTLTLAGTGTSLYITGEGRGQTFRNEGTITSGASTQLTLGNQATDTTRNAGTIRTVDGAINVGSGTVVNEATGTISVTRSATTASASLNNRGTLINEGTLRAYGAAISNKATYTTGLFTGGAFTNHGELSLASTSTGIASFSNSGTAINSGFFSISGGRLNNSYDRQIGTAITTRAIFINQAGASLSIKHDGSQSSYVTNIGDFINEGSLSITGSTFTNATQNDPYPWEGVSITMVGNLTNSSGATISVLRSGTDIGFLTNRGGILSNAGIINVSGGSLSNANTSHSSSSGTAVYKGQITNTGVINLSDGGALSNSGTFKNSGTLTLDGSSTTTILAAYSADSNSYGTWSNTGTIAATNGAALYLGGQFSTADIGEISVASGAKAYISGELNNSGATLSGPTGGSYILSGGRITGGTVNGSALVLTTGPYGISNSGYLRDLSVIGDLTFTGGSLTFEKGTGSGISMDGAIIFAAPTSGSNISSKLIYAYDATLTNNIVLQTTSTNTTSATLATTSSDKTIRITEGSTISQEGAGSANLYLGSLGATGGQITNRGTISIGKGSLYNSSSLLNQGSLSVADKYLENYRNITNDGSITAQQITNSYQRAGGTGSETITYTATIVSNSGSSIAANSISNTGTISNSGYLSVSGGSLSNIITNFPHFDGTYASATGRLTNTAGGVIAITKSATGGGFLTNSGARIENAGEINLIGSQLTNESIAKPNYVGPQTTYNGTIANSGRITLSGDSAFTNRTNSTFENSTEGRLILTGATQSITNSGYFTSHGALVATDSKFTNELTGSLLVGGGTFKVKTLFNNGTVRFAADSAPTDYSVTTFQQSSGTTVVNGTLSGTSMTISGGTLSGSGLINASVVLASGAHLAAGDNSVGTLTFGGGLTLNAGAALDFDLGSTSDLLRLSAGLLTVPATGTITLNLTGVDGFTAGSYNLITGLASTGLNTGRFSVSAAPTGYTYLLSLTDSALVVNVTSSAIPEPSTYGLIGGLAATAALVVRRHRRSIRTDGRKAA